MISRILTSSTIGIDAFFVEIETHAERALPAVTMVGLPDNAVKESKERVRWAIKNTGFEKPGLWLTIN